MTLYVAKDNKIYCVDIEQIPEESKDFFLV
jgi:hypothetical protein